MGVFDPDIILSWTPREYHYLMQGARHRQVDEWDLGVKQAFATAYAQNAKKANPKKIFDADKARRMIDKGDDNWKNAKQEDLSKAKKLTEAFRGFKPQFRAKGGN